MPGEVKTVTATRMRWSSKNRAERSHQSSSLTAPSSWNPCGRAPAPPSSMAEVVSAFLRISEPRIPRILSSPCFWTHTQLSVPVLTQKLPQKPSHLSGIPGVHPRHWDGACLTHTEEIYFPTHPPLIYFLTEAPHLQQRKTHPHTQTGPID